MSGRLFVIGTGPGNPDQMTPEALAAVDQATDVFGYGPYLDRLQLRPGQTRHASDNREELDRAGAALKAAAAGATACVVSGGDPGVFAMAAAVCEAIEHGLVTRSLESAQRKVEQRNFDIRKQLLEYDDVANDQRKVIYTQRNEILESDEISETITAMRQGVLHDVDGDRDIDAVFADIVKLLDGAQA